MPEVAIGDVIAQKYRVERIVGQGGMGVVVAAMHLALEERVALKLMRPEALLREDGVARFIREARAAVKLKSEHVARVLDVGTLESGAPYIAMEYLEGEDLAQRLAAGGPLQVADAVDIALQACDAVAEAHGRGIIHRDLKPANLFLARGRAGEPLVKVLDFGISKVSSFGDAAESVTNSAVLLGSPVYMSPEQMKSSRDVDRTTDVWSLGVILFEVLGGRVPFDEQTIGALMAKVLTEPPPSLADLCPGLPAEVVGAVARCLEKDPSKRFPSVLELARSLAPFGPASAADRLARIVAIPSAPSSAPAAASSAIRVSASPAVGATTTGSLGVAATQVAPDTIADPSTAPPRRHRAAYAFGALVVATLATVAVVSQRDSTPTVMPRPSARAPEQHDNAFEPASPDPSAEVLPRAAEPPAQRARPPIAPPQATPHPAQSRPAASSSAKADASDPWGNSRH